ncbi:MAG: DUF3187 family protein [Nitrospinae bacterium]|nr:DUF3187 family protein [Nitrospinota bacterium]
MRSIMAALLLLLPGEAHATDFHGPAPMKNRHPLYTGLLLPPPEAAPPVDRTRWEVSFDYTNVFLHGTDDHWAVAHDYELAALTVGARHPLGERLEAGFAAPLFYQYAGFMDGVLRAWHRLIGVRGYAGQDEDPDYRYQQHTTYDDKEVMRGREREVVPGDVTLWVKGRLWREGESLVSLALYGQLPTGDAGTGLGSGGYEYGLRLAGSTVAEGVGLTWGLGYTGPSRFAGIATGVDYAGMWTGFFASEWPLEWMVPSSDGWTMIVQSMANGSPVPETGFYQYGDPFYDLTVGLRHLLPDGTVWTVSLSENLNKTNPDFTLDVTVGW